MRCSATIAARLAVAALLAAAAAGTTTAGPPVRSLLEIRRERTVFQEWDLSCGAAALATLLNHQHFDPVTEREIALGLMGRDVYVANPLLVRVRQGFSLLDLKRYVDARGYRGVGLGGLDVDSLVARAPILTPIRTYGYNHFVVVRGRMGNRLLLADPNFGTRTMTVARFESAWIDYGPIGRVGFIVTRDGEPAPPGDLAPRREEFVMLR